MRPNPDGIVFLELSSRAADFLHELSDPGVVRPEALAPEIVEELRAEQIARLRENIVSLRQRQDEFNRKIDEYVGNLERLIRSLEAAPENARNGRGRSATHVTCPRCAAERDFPHLRIIFARESDESFLSPTDCYVSDHGRLVKGRFRCTACGAESLTIRPYHPGDDLPRR